MEELEIRVGSAWHKTLLGSEAVYRVVAITADVVTVEVRSAPGLRPGTRLKFLRYAFSAMEEIDGG